MYLPGSRRGAKANSLVRPGFEYERRVNVGRFFSFVLAEELLEDDRIAFEISSPGQPSELGWTFREVREPKGREVEVEVYSRA